MPDETREVLTADAAADEPHVRVHGHHDGDYEVWLNPDCTPHTGLCIGVGDTRAEAVADAERTLERALEDIRKAARDAQHTTPAGGHSPGGPAMKTKTIVLTIPEAKHLLTLLADAAERGDYYGNRTQYWRRHQRIIDKLEHAPEDQAMTDQTPDTIRALADRLERRADIEDVGTEETDAAYDVPEVTWEEMREIVGLLREAASTLRALADQGQRAIEEAS